MKIRPRKPNWIYFIYDAQAGAIKIGTSTDVTRRLSELQTSSATPLRLFGVMKGGRFEEQRLHTKFTRLHGEWFRADSALLDFIGQHTEVTQEFHRVRQPRTPPAPTLHPMPSFRADLHHLATIELVGLLVVAAWYVLVNVLLPPYHDIMQALNLSYAAITLVYGCIVLWALTYRYRKEQVLASGSLLAMLGAMIGRKIRAARGEPEPSGPVLRVRDAGGERLIPR